MASIAHEQPPENTGGGRTNVLMPPHAPRVGLRQHGKVASGHQQQSEAHTWRQSSPDLMMMGRTAQPGRRPCGDCACTRRALSAKLSPYTARARDCAAAAAGAAPAAAPSCGAPGVLAAVLAWTQKQP